jgi:type IV secretion system protein TrbI
MFDFKRKPAQEAQGAPQQPVVENQVAKAPGTIPDHTKRVVIVVGIIVVVGIMAIGHQHKVEKAGDAQPGPTLGRLVQPRPAPAQDVTLAQQTATRMQQEYQQRLAQTAGASGGTAQTPVVNPQQAYQQYQQNGVAEDPLKEKMRELEVARDFEGPSVFGSDTPQQQWSPGAEPQSQQAPQVGQSPSYSAEPVGQASLENMAHFLQAMQAARESQGTVVGSAPPGTSGGPMPAGNPSQPAGDTQRSVDQDVAQPGQFNQADGKDYVMFEGTIIECVLVNRLDGEFSGPVEAETTTDVLSHDGKHILVPAGTKALGEAKQVTDRDQRGLAVVFHRLLMPDGYSVSLDRFTGLGQQGSTAIQDKVNHHYAELFGASIAIGLLAGLEMSSYSGSVLSTQGAYREGLAEEGGMEGQSILGRFLNRLPQVVIREGTRLKIFVAEDLRVPAYENHRMPGDI